MMTDAVKVEVVKRFITSHKMEYVEMFLRQSKMCSENYYLDIFNMMLNAKFGEVILDHDLDTKSTSYTIPIPAGRHRGGKDVLFFWRDFHNNPAVGGDGESVS